MKNVRAHTSIAVSTASAAKVQNIQPSREANLLLCARRFSSCSSGIENNKIVTKDWFLLLLSSFPNVTTSNARQLTVIIIIIIRKPKHKNKLRSGHRIYILYCAAHQIISSEDCLQQYILCQHNDVVYLFNYILLYPPSSVIV